MTPKYCELNFIARGRQIVLGYFLGLELQKLLIGCLSGTFIDEFLKSLKVLRIGQDFFGARNWPCLSSPVDSEAGLISE
jgi:hypothetical protein